MTIEIRILGPVELVIDASVVHIGGQRPLAVLAALTLDIGHAVPIDRLIADVWGEDPPPAVDSDLQSHISRIRAAIGPNRLVSEDRCYALMLEPTGVDAIRFERLVVDAEASLHHEPEAAFTALTDALALWRGDPFGSLGDLPFLQGTTRRLLELRLTAMEMRIEAEFALGHHARPIPLLQHLVEEQPYRERLWYLLADGLARDGRRVEGLRVLRRLEHLLGDVGLQPSRDIRTLEQQIIDEEEPHVAHLAPRDGA